MNPEVIWLVILTLALATHMFKDASEFKKIKALEDELGKLKR